MLQKFSWKVCNVAQIIWKTETVLSLLVVVQQVSEKCKNMTFIYTHHIYISRSECAYSRTVLMFTSLCFSGRNLDKDVLREQFISTVVQGAERN